MPGRSACLPAGSAGLPLDTCGHRLLVTHPARPGLIITAQRKSFLGRVPQMTTTKSLRRRPTWQRAAFLSKAGTQPPL